MTRTLGLFGLAASILLPAAVASPVEFLASGTFETGQTLSGEVTIDTATGAALSGDLKISGISSDFTLLDLQRTWPPSPDTPFMTELEFQNGLASNNLLTFLFQPDSLIGYPGGVLCGSTPAVCQGPADGQILTFLSNYATLSGGFVTDFHDLTSGSLTPAPEPATILMIVAPAAIVLFRRRRRRSAQSA